MSSATLPRACTRKGRDASCTTSKYASLRARRRARSFRAWERSADDSRHSAPLGAVMQRDTHLLSVGRDDLTHRRACGQTRVRNGGEVPEQRDDARRQPASPLRRRTAGSATVGPGKCLRMGRAKRQWTRRAGPVDAGRKARPRGVDVPVVAALPAFGSAAAAARAATGMPRVFGEPAAEGSIVLGRGSPASTRSMTCQSNVSDM